MKLITILIFTIIAYKFVNSQSINFNNITLKGSKIKIVTDEGTFDLDTKIQFKIKDTIAQFTIYKGEPSKVQIFKLLNSKTISPKNAPILIEALEGTCIEFDDVSKAEKSCSIMITKKGLQYTVSITIRNSDKKMVLTLYEL